jgi:hypothetical protein
VAVCSSRWAKGTSIVLSNATRWTRGTSLVLSNATEGRWGGEESAIRNILAMLRIEI